MDLAFEPRFAVSCEPERFVVVGQRTEVIKLVDELEDVIQLVFDLSLLLLGVGRVSSVGFVVENALFVEKKVLVDPAEGLHGLIRALTVDVCTCLFI